MTGPAIPNDWTGCERYRGYAIALKQGSYGVFAPDGKLIAQCQASRWAARRLIEGELLSAPELRAIRCGEGVLL